jgi:hypothetical protein
VIERAETKLTPQKRDALGDFMEGWGGVLIRPRDEIQVAIGRLTRNGEAESR